MTSPTDNQPPAVDDARRQFAHILTGRTLPGIDPDRLAAALVQTLLDQKWRPPHRPPDPTPRRPPDPDTYSRGAARARAALNHARARIAARQKTNDQGKETTP